MGEIQQQPEPSVSATPAPREPAVVPAPIPAPVPAQPNAGMTQQSSAAAAPNASSAEQLEQARQAMEAKMKELETSQSQAQASNGQSAGGPVYSPIPAPPSQPRPDLPPVSPSSNPYSVRTPPGFTPLPAPPPAVSASKEQQLHQLLQLYMADKISPEEYHARRAKILAEP